MEKGPRKHVEFQQAIAELQSDVLFNLRNEIKTSTTKLNETNHLLREEVENSENLLQVTHNNLDTKEIQSDLAIFKDALQENFQVILNNEEKIKALEQELAKRGLNAPSTAQESSALDDKGIYL